MAYNEKTGDSPIVAVPADTRSSGSIHDVHEEKAAGAHVLDVEVANITGDIPLHPHPRGPNDGFDDLKEELESKIEVIDWYKPFPLVPGAREETSILTFRAIIVGIILGSLTICSNVYLGLKTGITFSSNLFGAVFGYGIVKMFEKSFGNLPILGGPFGPQENCIVQSAATGAGGLSNLFVATIPAMYQLQLLSEKIIDDFGRLITLTLIGSFFGVFFVTPLRKYFIIKVARELKLIFPTSSATAMTIRSMHATGQGGIDAIKKLKGLMISFFGSLVWRVASYYCIGIMYDWHIFTWFFIWSGYSNLALAGENWGWWIEWTPAFIGSGMLVGLNTGWSLMAGSITGYGIIGPVLVLYGAAKGTAHDPDDPIWGGYISYNSMSQKTITSSVPSPRYWLLWPAVFTMVAVSIAEFCVQYKMIGYAFKTLFQESCASLLTIQKKRGKTSAFLEKHGQAEILGEEDFAQPKDQMKTWEWSSGLLITIIVTFVICQVQFDMHPGFSLLASVLSVLFAFLAIQCAGQTDWVPLTAAAKATQLVLGPASLGSGSIPHRQTINLVGGAIASSAADMSVTLVSDFRTGFLLSTPPRKQWIAQAYGSLVAVFLAPGIFVLFMTAYPCIYRPDDYDTCAFSAPSVAAWKAVAQAVTQNTLAIPTSSGIFTGLIAGIAVLQTIFRQFYLIGEREKYRKYLPNWMAISIGWLIPQTCYSTAMLMGAHIAHLWMKKWPKSFDIYCYAVAAGFMAGEGIGGVIGAILTIAGVDGTVYGTNIACPMNEC